MRQTGQQYNRKHTMTLVWNDTYKINHAEIDAQHQELFARANQFLLASDNKNYFDERFTDPGSNTASFQPTPNTTCRCGSWSRGRSTFYLQNASKSCKGKGLLNRYP